MRPPRHLRYAIDSRHEVCNLSSDEVDPARVLPLNAKPSPDKLMAVNSRLPAYRYV